MGMLICLIRRRHRVTFGYRFEEQRHGGQRDAGQRRLSSDGDVRGARADLCDYRWGGVGNRSWQLHN